MTGVLPFARAKRRAVPGDCYDSVRSTASPAAQDANIDGVDRFLSCDKGIGEVVEADNGFALSKIPLKQSHPASRPITGL